MTARNPTHRMGLHDVALGLQRHIVDDVINGREAVPDVAPTSESGRLAALRRYDVLNTGPDETFDSITRLAGLVLDSPAAAITFIDSDRAWFKSRYGWDGHQQIDRGVSFCATTYPGGREPWTIPDAVLDPRTRDNPLVLADPRVRSYAGAPLISHDGHNLGALCVFDHESREYTSRQLDALRDLAGLVLHEMEMRLATRRALFPDS